MPKKVKFESFKYRFLVAAQYADFLPEDGSDPAWPKFLRDLEFNYHRGEVVISWKSRIAGQLIFSLGEAKLYMRGDNVKGVSQQLDAGMMSIEDPVKLHNNNYFSTAVTQVAKAAGYRRGDGAKTSRDLRLQKERTFHDAWAESEEVEKIDVRAANSACTAPEMRYITNRLGDLAGRRLLDVGCGLGEASVYFAILGADVTSSDLSQGMLDATSRLARANNVNIRQHLATAEDLQLPPDAKFDVIYAGNLLHHVDIEQTISRLKPHLAPNGVLVTWDPLAYNPAINVYRGMATDVRTPDEHPLKWRDIRLFHKHFRTVHSRYFWLTTLVIFVIMAVAQGRNPNSERFWKIVVQEGEKWRWLYDPLEKLDRLLLALFPPLRLLCWNVVFICRA
jgi:2-polyprenyl-3-methyl-5-hydroxy-6-metoxy-1,4-benzoquinol methylase